MLYLCNLLLFTATMTKIIKEMLPPDVRVARDAQDLLIECCVGKRIALILSKFFLDSAFGLQAFISYPKKIISESIVFSNCNVVQCILNRGYIA